MLLNQRQLDALSITKHQNNDNRNLFQKIITWNAWLEPREEKKTEKKLKSKRETHLPLPIRRGLKSESLYSALWKKISAKKTAKILRYPHTEEFIIMFKIWYESLFLSHVRKIHT